MQTYKIHFYRKDIELEKSPPMQFWHADMENKYGKFHGSGLTPKQAQLMCKQNFFLHLGGTASTPIPNELHFKFVPTFHEVEPK